MIQHRALLLPMMLCLGLSACSSTPDEKLETRGEFVSRDVGNTTEFAYSMTWYVPKDAGRNALLAALGLNPRRRGSSALNVDKAGRLALEDQAALELEGELRTRALCENGYRIDQTKWHDRSVTLIGQCR